MTNDSRNNDSTKEYKPFKKAVEDGEQTRVFQPVSEQLPVRTSPAANQGQAESEKSELRKRGEKAPSEASASKMPPWLRAALKVLRTLLVPILCVIALYIGLYVGYAVFGNEAPADIWKFETWKHLYDLIFADSPSS